jgi:hypothetical protein
MRRSLAQLPQRDLASKAKNGVALGGDGADIERQVVFGLGFTVVVVIQCSPGSGD